MYEDRLAALKLVLSEKEREIKRLNELCTQLFISKIELINENEKLKEELKELRNEGNT
jgi:hypothetical protein